MTGVDVWGSGFANMAWPWLALAVLGVGALMTVVTGFAPLRGLGLAVRSLSPRGRDAVAGADRQSALAVPLAAAAGMGGITGATLAVTAGGPGALPWMWIAAVLGMGLSFAEGALGATTPDGRSRHHLAGDGTVAKLLGPIYALAILAVAVVAGAMLQTHEAAAVLEETMWVPPASASVGIALLAVVFIFSSAARSLLLRLVPVVLLLFALSAAAIAFSDGMLLQLRLGDAFNAAFGLDAAAGGAAGGVVAVAIHHGVLRATLAGEAGLGTAALAGIVSKRPAAAGALTMLVPALAAGLLGTLSALVLLTGNGPEALPRVVADAVLPKTQQPVFSPIVADKTMFPLERAESRGLRPSQQVGQTIVMPQDTTLEAGEHYAVLLRSSARGHATAKLDVERNAVILPGWQVADDVEEVIFRAREDDRGALAGWDIRVPCDREVRAPQAGGPEFLKLTPKDPNLKLGELITSLRLSPKAYVPIGDFHFTGRLGRATVGDLGAHVAMFEPRRADRPFNPKLHEFFRNGFRGPYADDGSPPAPFAFVTEAGYTPDVGSIVRLTLQAHPRGEPMLDVTRAGNLEAPAWKFLMKATTVVLRHETEPSKDLRFEVKARIEQFRIRYDVVGGEHDFSRIAEGWHGPFIVVPDFEFEAEVRGDSRLPAALSGRRVLIPVHETSGPQGPYGDQWPYEPHPSDVLAMGMHGPTLSARGAARVAVRFSGHLGPLGTIAIVVCTIIFALTTLVAWSQISARAAAALGGASAAKAMPAVLVAAAAAGAWVSLTPLIAVADVAMAVAVATNLVALLLALPRVIAAGRDLSGGNS